MQDVDEDIDKMSKHVYERSLKKTGIYKATGDSIAYMPVLNGLTEDNAVFAGRE